MAIYFLLCARQKKFDFSSIESPNPCLNGETKIDTFFLFFMFFCFLVFLILRQVRSALSAFLLSSTYVCLIILFSCLIAELKFQKSLINRVPNQKLTADDPVLKLFIIILIWI